jgi:tight adherence protein B
MLSERIIPSVVMFVGVGAAVFLGYRPLANFMRRRERDYDRDLRRNLLIDISPRAATILSIIVILLLGFLGYVIGGLWAAIVGGALGVFLPAGVLRYLRKRRVNRLEVQLVPGIQTLASGVRAGLNLVQSMQLVARDGPLPLRQEIQHLLREYEYGLPLETAMRNSAGRIGSEDFRLLFLALETHRQRGGDLGETLDRIADSIREIQRLESRVKSLTAQGRATARWLGAMPVIVLAILYFLVDPEGVKKLFTDDIGKLLLFGIFALTAIGFLWVRKIVSIDV